MADLTLMIPGPISVRPEVLQAMATPPWGHRDQVEINQRMQPLHANLRKLLDLGDSDYQALVLTASGTALLEAAIINCVPPGAKVLSVSVGAFGELWHAIAQSWGRETEFLQFEYGRHADVARIDQLLSANKFAAVTVTMNETSTGVENPIAQIGQVVKGHECLYFVDAISCMGGVPVKPVGWGIDMVVGSSQKSIGLPAGLAVAAISPRALTQAAAVAHRGTYLDLLAMVKSNEKYQTPTTPSSSHLDALTVQLDYIVNTEGLEARFERHRQLSRRVHEWVACRGNLSLLPDPDYASKTVTCIRHPEDWDKNALQDQLRRRGFLLDKGYRGLTARGIPTFRIPTMGDLTMGVLENYLGHLDELLPL